MDNMNNVEIVGAIKIKDGLFIGDEYSAQDLDFVMANKVTQIINCAGNEVPDHWEPIGVRYLTYTWADMDNQVILDSQDLISNQFNQFIDESLDKGDSVLVHSVKGQSRACTVTAAFLMKRYRWTLLKTLEFLNSRRPDLEIRACFIHQLTAYENRLVSRGIGPRTSKWTELSEVTVHFENEELLLRNTFLNSQMGPLAEYGNILSDMREQPKKLRWPDNMRESNKIASIIPPGKDLINMSRIPKVTSHKRIDPNSLIPIRKGAERRSFTPVVERGARTKERTIGRPNSAGGIQSESKSVESKIHPPTALRKQGKGMEKLLVPGGDRGERTLGSQNPNLMIRGDVAGGKKEKEKENNKGGYLGVGVVHPRSKPVSYRQSKEDEFYRSLNLGPQGTQSNPGTATAYERFLRGEEEEEGKSRAHKTTTKPYARGDIAKNLPIPSDTQPNNLNQISHTNKYDQFAHEIRPKKLRDNLEDKKPLKTQLDNYLQPHYNNYLEEGLGGSYPQFAKTTGNRDFVENTGGFAQDSNKITDSLNQMFNINSGITNFQISRNMKQESEGSADHYKREINIINHNNINNYIIQNANEVQMHAFGGNSSAQTSSSTSGAPNSLQATSAPRNPKQPQRASSVTVKREPAIKPPLPKRTSEDDHSTFFSGGSVSSGSKRIIKKESPRTLGHQGKGLPSSYTRKHYGYNANTTEGNKAWESFKQMSNNNNSGGTERVQEEYANANANENENVNRELAPHLGIAHPSATSQALSSIRSGPIRPTTEAIQVYKTDTKTPLPPQHGILKNYSEGSKIGSGVGTGSLGMQGQSARKKNRMTAPHNRPSSPGIKGKTANNPYNLYGNNIKMANSLGVQGYQATTGIMKGSKQHRFRSSSPSNTLPDPDLHIGVIRGIAPPKPKWKF